MESMAFLVVFILYGWVMFYLGGLEPPEEKARVAETSDTDPRQ